MGLFTKFFTKSNPVSAFIVQSPGTTAHKEKDYIKISKEAYQYCSIAFRAIDKIAKSVSKIPIVAYTEDETGERVDLPNTHPLVQLLNRPNPIQSRVDLIYYLTSYKLLDGNGYLVKTHSTGDRNKKTPLELYTVQPNYIFIEKGADGIPNAYKVGSSESNAKRYDVNQVSGRSDIMHWKTFHPTNMWYGLSPMQAAGIHVDTFNQSQLWNYSLLKNGGKPLGAVKYTGENQLSKKQFEEFKTRVKTEVSDAVNAGTVLALDGQFDWVQISTDPVDMDFTENQLNAARFIASVYGVPPQIINIPGENTYSNMQEAKEEFWTDTVIPTAESVVEKLEHWLSPFYDEGIKLTLDYDKIEALERKRTQKREGIVGLVDKGIISRKEARQMLGYDELDANDSLLVPANLIPLSLAEEGVETEEEAEEIEEEKEYIAMLDSKGEPVIKEKKNKGGEDD